MMCGVWRRIWPQFQGTFRPVSSLESPELPNQHEPRACSKQAERAQPKTLFLKRAAGADAKSNWSTNPLHIHLYMQIYIYLYVHVYVSYTLCKYCVVHTGTCVYTRIYTYGSGSKPCVVAGPLPPLCYEPLSRPAVTNPLSRIFCGNAALCFGGVCRGGVCRKTPRSVTNLCREMAAEACYKPAVFDSLPYVECFRSSKYLIQEHIPVPSLLKPAPQRARSSHTASVQPFGVCSELAAI